MLPITSNSYTTTKPWLWPATSSVTGWRSMLLNYRTIYSNHIRLHGDACGDRTHKFQRERLATLPIRPTHHIGTANGAGLNQYEISPTSP